MLYLQSCNDSSKQFIDILYCDNCCSYVVGKRERSNDTWKCIFCKNYCNSKTCLG